MDLDHHHRQSCRCPFPWQLGSTSHRAIALHLDADANRFFVFGSSTCPSSSSLERRLCVFSSSGRDKGDPRLPPPRYQKVVDQILTANKVRLPGVTQTRGGEIITRNEFRSWGVGGRRVGRGWHGQCRGGSGVVSSKTHNCISHVPISTLASLSSWRKGAPDKPENAPPPHKEVGHPLGTQAGWRPR